MADDATERAISVAGVSQRSRPTQKDIAFMTGLGVATVSRALKDAPDIGESTKERVRLVAKQIGYQPNRAGVRLRTGKTHVISIVLHHKDEVADFMPQMMFGVSEALVGTPYHLVMTPYFMDADPLEPVYHVVESGTADGIIISRIERDDARVRYLSEQGFPFVAHGRTEMGIDHPFHDFDNAAYARQAVAWLAARGRKRIALLGPPHDLTFAHHIEQGFIRAIAEHSLDEVPLHATIDNDYVEIIAEAKRIMNQRTPPDGIVCAGPGAALAAITGIEEAGFTIGDQIDIVTKQSSGLRFRPAMHVIKEDHRAAGRTLARAVIAVIDGAAAESHQTLEIPQDTDGDSPV
ncbi:MAG: LacI family transcriptional regulator [Alphaproteobacteria bacterium]